MTILFGSLLAGVVTVSACSDDDETGGSTTSTSTSSSSSSSTTSTSSSTSGTGGCDIDFVQTWGATQECNDCVAEYCCPQAEFFEADPTRETYEVLWACATNDATCRAPCRAYACNDTLAWVFNAPCAAHVDANCCAVWADCKEDLECSQCGSAFGFTAEPCCGNAAYLAMIECTMEGGACDLSLIERETCPAGGAGGTGGSGGAGGTGGTGGTGGAGGS